VEPARIFHELEHLHRQNDKVKCYNLAIADAHGMVTLYESGAHVPNGNDRALVSSLSKAETERWSLAGVKFEAVEVNTLPFNSFWELTDFAQFDFITMDVESYEWMILQQMDLKALGCKCLCIEYNGHENRRKQFGDYCAQFGLKEVLKNNENLIYCL
jgi:FkbM family methyltransferase